MFSELWVQIYSKRVKTEMIDKVLWNVLRQRALPHSLLLHIRSCRWFLFESMWISHELWRSRTRRDARSLRFKSYISAENHLKKTKLFLRFSKERNNYNCTIKVIKFIWIILNKINFIFLYILQIFFFNITLNLL